jgi:hypothetical protein
MDTTGTEKLLTGDCLGFLNRMLGQLKDPYSNDIHEWVIIIGPEKSMRTYGVQRDWGLEVSEAP